MRAALAALLLGCALSAMAGSIDTPQCRADLAKASALVDAVAAARNRAGPVRDAAAMCAALRQNMKDMRDAATRMDRCLTGHERGENVAQIRASVEDVGEVVRARCR